MAANKFLTNIDLSKNEIQNVSLQKLSSAPNNPVKGQVYYNTGDNLIYVQVLNSTDTGYPLWKIVGGEHSDVTSDAGKVITGVTTVNGVTSFTLTDVVDLELDGFTRNTSANYPIADGDTLEDAISKMENKIDDIVTQGGEPNVIENVTMGADATEGTITNKVLNLPNATTTADGIMSHADKSKLNNIAAGAEVNQNAFSNVKAKNGSTETTVSAGTKTDTFTITGSGSIAVTGDTSTKTITISGSNDNDNQTVKVGSTTFGANDAVGFGTASGSHLTFTGDNSADTITLSVDSGYSIPSTTDQSAWSAKQNALTFDNTPTDGSTNPVTSDGIYEFVNSSIQNVAAYYIVKNAQGDPFATHAELTTISTVYSGGEVRVPTRNDYAIVIEDETHPIDEGTFSAKNDYIGFYINTGSSYTKVTSSNVDTLSITPGTTVAYLLPTSRYIYPVTSSTYDPTAWEFQYIVNNTPLTAKQIAAINSGINANLVSLIPQGTADNHLLVSVAGGSNKWSDWSTAGLLKTNTSGEISIDTNTYLTSHQSIKTLKTNNSTAQSTSASEAIAGSGTINLHKIAKTGTYSDLIGKPNLAPVATSGDYLDLINQPLKLVTYGELTSDDIATIAANVKEYEETYDTPLIYICQYGSVGSIVHLRLINSDYQTSFETGEALSANVEFVGISENILYTLTGSWEADPGGGGTGSWNMDSSDIGEGTVKSVRVQAGTGLTSSQSTAQTETLNTTISIASGYTLPTTTDWTNTLSYTKGLIPLKVQNGALTASSGVCTWTISASTNYPSIPPTLKPDFSSAIVSVREVSSGTEVYCEVTYSESSITIKINSASNIAANTYIAVIHTCCILKNNN